MSERHPDTSRPDDADAELDIETQRSSEQLGRADLDDELTDEQAAELGDERERGQNSDWMPQ